MWFPGSQKPLRGTLIDPSHPLSRGLVRAWAFNELSGETLHDSVGGFGKGTISGASWEADSLAFDGSDYVDPANDYNIIDAITVFVRLKRTDNASYSHAVGRHPDWFVGCGGDANQNKFRFMINNSNSSGYTDAINANQIYNVVGRYDHANVSIWLDGVSIASAAYSTNIGTTGTTTIGNYSDHGSTYTWPGNIYAVYIWNRALSTAEIQWLHRESYAMFARSRIAVSEEPAVVRRQWWPGFQKPLRGMQLDKSHPMVKGMVGAWVMNEGSGSHLQNHASGFLHGSINTNTSWAPGSLEFGSDGRVDCGTDDLVGGSEGITVVAGIRDDGSNSFGRIADKSYNGQFAFYITDTNRLGCAFVTDTGSIDDFADLSMSQLIAGQEYSVAFRWSGAIDYIQYFIDGMHEASADASIAGNTVATSSAPFYIGNHVTFNRDFLGRIRFVYLFDRALTDAEIALLHREPYCMFDNVRRLGVSEEEEAGDRSVSVGGTLAAITSSEDAEVLVDGDVAGTLEAITASINAVTVNERTAVVDGDLAAITSEQSAEVLVDGALAGTLTAITSEHSAEVLVDGSVAGTLEAITSEINVETLNDRDVTVGGTLASITSEQSAKVLVDGDVAGTLAAITSEKSAEVLVDGVVDGTLEAITSKINVNTTGDINAQVGGTLAPITASLAAEVLVSSEVAATLAAITANVNAQVEVAGVIDADLAALTARIRVNTTGYTNTDSRIIDGAGHSIIGG